MFILYQERQGTQIHPAEFFNQIPVSPLTLARYYSSSSRISSISLPQSEKEKFSSHPSGTDCSHFCGRKNVFRTSNHNSSFSHLHSSQQKLYVILIENTSLSCYHNCVVHVEIIFVTYLYLEIYNGFTQCLIGMNELSSTVFLCIQSSPNQLTVHLLTS